MVNYRGLMVATFRRSALMNCLNLNLNLTKQGHLKNCLNQTTAMRMFLKLKTEAVQKPHACTGIYFI
ncbi:hypothetical protein DPMN_135612 [Dreissena polymorpha]|uniref:Uncharacterized protein n=1 Tax=Dreissena polymorpha TaxID=45954 RepID=A0A9D4JH16_DREPO|nr:hypothetical protein DPMN_135612 [Dreissena polymorpha]